MQAFRLLLVGAALCNVVFCTSMAGAAFCGVSKVLFLCIALSGLYYHNTVAKIVEGAAFVTALKSWEKPVKYHTFGGL